VQPAQFQRQVVQDVATASGLSPSQVVFEGIDVSSGDPTQMFGVNVVLYAGSGPSPPPSS